MGGRRTGESGYLLYHSGSDRHGTEPHDKKEGGTAVMAKQSENQVSAVRKAKHGWVLTLFFSALTVFYLYPIFLVVINAFKKKGFITK